MSDFSGGGPLGSSDRVGPSVRASRVLHNLHIDFDGEMSLYVV